VFSLITRQPRVRSSLGQWKLLDQATKVGGKWSAEAMRTFAGHNKWSKIRHKKGAKDKARASLLGKALRAITAATLDCGGDLSNLRLQSCIAHANAKAVQLPKDRIDDAIQKAVARDNNLDRMEIVRYDAMIQVGGST
jgi:transcriptional/translational regulatory protein YebC/TACO1